MSSAHPAGVNQLLLDMLAGKDNASLPARIAAVADADWPLLTRSIQQHRLGPLLHWRLRSTQAALALPAALTQTLAQRFRASTLRALRLQTDLVHTTRLLRQHGIESIALKGAYLSLFAYPHPALRPMRDLDLLVPKAQALQAFAVLVDAGYQRDSGPRLDPAAVMAQDKHLPRLYCPTSGTMIELHTRIASGHDPINYPAIFADEQHWQRQVFATVGGETIGFLAPSDLLLHLIVHAVYDDHFLNGPLVLSDIAYLVSRHPIDWPAFWQRANAAQVHIAAQFLLAGVAHYYPDCMAAPSKIPLPADLASMLADMLLMDTTRRDDTTRSAEFANLQSWHDKLSYAARRALPTPASIAARYPVAADSLWLPLFYLIHLVRMICLRLPQRLLAQRQANIRHDRQAINAFYRWLHQHRSG